MKLGHWQKFQKLDMYSFYPRGSKLSLFLLYGQRFSRYGTIFKISIFGHEICNFKTVPKIAIVLFLPQGAEIKLIFALWVAVFEIEQFKALISLINLFSADKIKRLHIVSFTPKELKLFLFSLDLQPFS